MDDEGKRKEKKEKEEKFFWNDSVKPLEWNLQKFPVVSPLPFTRKKSVVSRPQICYALFFREQRTERERKAGNRDEIIWKTRRKSTISLAIKNLVINKLIPLLSRARDFVCQLRMYKRNVAARNRCGLTAQLHSLSSSRWILFLVNELRSWISPYTFHFRGRYISLLHLVHPFPMKIIEQFRVNQLPFPKRLKDSKGRGKGMASSSFSFINTRGIEGTYIRIGVIFQRVNHGEITSNDECEFVGRSTERNAGEERGGKGPFCIIFVVSRNESRITRLTRDISPINRVSRPCIDD